MIQPFSQEFEREFNRIKSVVDLLEARLQEVTRLQGSMYDRINQEAAQLQFALFCDVVGGDKGEEYDLEPAFGFYGVDGDEDFDKKMELVGAPQYVVDEFSDEGIVKAKIVLTIAITMRMALLICMVFLHQSHQTADCLVKLQS